ncbi:MAG TPA: amidohydrolase family protein [Acidimicrobiales bacterium]
MTPLGAEGPIDAHVHMASHDEIRYPRHPTPIGSDWWRRGGYEVDDVLDTLAGAGVAQMVAVQAAGAYGDDNRYVVDVAKSHPDSLRAVAVVDPDDPGAAEIITELAACRGVSGVRCMAVRPSATWVGTEKADNAFAAAADSGLTVVLTVFTEQLLALRPVLERFSDVPVVLDHCAFADMSGATVARDSPLPALAGLPHVTVKVTSHNLNPLGAGGAARPFVGQLVGWFGTHRILWGSDYPQTTHDNYAGLVDLATDAFADLAPAERAAVLGGNTRRLFGFGGESGGR